MLITHAIGILFGALTILCHYEALRLLFVKVPQLPLPPRFRMLTAVFALFLAHGFEIWLFALALYIGQAHLDLGELSGQFNGSIRDFGYFSAVAYTSLGFGDIYPTDKLRTLVAYETVTGLLMMAWSAAFTLHFMQKHWDEEV